MDKKKIGITLDPALHAKIKSAAPLRGVNLEKAYDQGMRKWLDEKTATPETLPSRYSHENGSLHDRLETILLSGDEPTIAAVVSNIEVFFDRLKPQRGGRRSGPPQISEAEETRLLDEYRRSSHEKRRRMLAFSSTTEDLGPEVMPNPKGGARRRSG
jgi:hypothetical protein